MVPAIKAKWIDAMMHGGYDQCVGRLEMTDETGHKSFCCLGILREVADPNHTIEEKFPDSISNKTQFGLSQGLTQPQLDALMTLNDEYRVPFPGIAKFVAAFL